MEAIEALREEGVDVFGGGSEEKKPSGFETSTVDIAKGMHRPDKEQAELHGNIPLKVLAPVFEMHVIENAARTEQKMMKTGRKTVSKVQEETNDAMVTIMEDTNKNMMRELAALEGRSRDDAKANIGSLVAGEQMKNAAMNPFGMDNPNIVTRFKRLILGGKAK